MTEALVWDSLPHNFVHTAFYILPTQLPKGQREPALRVEGIGDIPRPSTKGQPASGGRGGIPKPRFRVHKGGK